MTRWVKPLLQLVLGNDGWLAGIPTGTTPVANLRGDPGLGRQPSHPVLGNELTLIAQIVCQLAIAIDLATVGPGLPDQFGLARVFLRTVT